MTAKTRNWLITLLILTSPFLFFLGLLLFWTAEPLPPVAPLPARNGYELDKGHSPASAGDLAPAYLKAVPQDPFTGRNLDL